jgi:hypothetical protein
MALIPLSDRYSDGLIPHAADRGASRICPWKNFTHLPLEKDAPVSRTVDRAGHIPCGPALGGLHH